MPAAKILSEPYSFRGATRYPGSARLTPANVSETCLSRDLGEMSHAFEQSRRAVTPEAL
jgi:hypothetical protein